MLPSGPEDARANLFGRRGMPAERLVVDLNAARDVVVDVKARAWPAMQ